MPLITQKRSQERVKKNYVSNAIAIVTLQIVGCFVIYIFFLLHMRLPSHKGQQDVEGSGVSCRDGGYLLVAEHGLDHLTTADGEDGEERITQL
jgi:hypothetical protein